MKISFILSFFFLIKITNTNPGFVPLFYRQRIGRMLVEVFRTAANNGTKLNVNEVMQSVQQIVEDPGKFKIYFFSFFFPPFLITEIHLYKMRKLNETTFHRFNVLFFIKKNFKEKRRQSFKLLIFL